MWLTLEQFLNLGKKCDKCEKPAKWLASGENWPVYCDDCFPFKNIENLEEKQKGGK